METKYKIIGNNIKVLRERYNFTQIEVANFLGLGDHVTISYYENGERKIPLDHLTKIADLFGVELEILLTENPEEQLVNKVFAFRKNELKENDFNVIADFHRIVKNYIKLRNLEAKHAVKS
jgi:transcriptional regulator with XRE-family HTH domain